MNLYICNICGYIYDETQGSPETGVAPGTKWEELPDSWECPICGAPKSDFMQEGGDPVVASEPVRYAPVEDSELNVLQMSELCSNLARGSEKQYQKEQAALFRELADYFKQADTPVETASWEALQTAIDEDLTSGFASANQVAKAAGDRGAQRALVWGEKVSKIQRSVVERYREEGEAMLEGKNGFLCTICGFIYVGDEAPELCPVCKVPSWKIEKVEVR